MARFEIRPAGETDLPAMRDIYNHYVRTSLVTFDEEEWTEPRWREKFVPLWSAGTPVLMAETPDGRMLGYAYVQPWRAKSAYRFAAEDSIYLAPDAGGAGVGTALLGALLVAAKAAGLREIIAVIADTDAAGSVALHEKLGFVEVGRLRGVGLKFGRRIGIIHLQKSLQASGD